MTPARQRLLVTVLIGLGIVTVGFFGLRAFFAFREFRRHGPPPLPPFEAQQVETDVELIRDWMTIPYISRMYQVPPKVLFDAVGIPPKGNAEKNLAQLNEEFQPDKPGIVLEVVKAAVAAHQPPPTADTPPTPPPAPTTVPYQP